jgi:MoxR-like ATPase
LTFDNPLFEPSRRAPGRFTEMTGEDHDAYVFDDDRIVQAVNVALATRRPLLVTGLLGSGKSALARAVAREKRWDYVEEIITSRTELYDLTAGFDAVRRLADAQLHRLLPDWCYVEPGVLWWAFDPGSAASRGHDADELDEARRAALPSVPDPRAEGGGGPNIVVLLDEIDKAEPDLPNDLLGPLDRLAFDGPGGLRIVASGEVFVVIASNGERRLPPAFLRRCAQLVLRAADEEFFVAVADVHFGVRTDTLYLDIATDFIRFQEAARKRDRREPATAEFLATVRACLRFGEKPGSRLWNAIVESALWKNPQLPEEVTDDRSG